MSVKLSCGNVSMTITSLSICGSLMYLPFLVKTCSSGMQLTMKANGNTLCTLQMFTFLSLPVGSETSSCLELTNLMTLKFGVYFASQFNFLLKFLIIIKFLFYIVVCIIFVFILLRTCLFCITCW